jgi:hypothetical protein
MRPWSTELLDNPYGEYKVLDCARGRIAQARAPDCGFNPCSAETGSVRRREASSCYDERNMDAVRFYSVLAVQPWSRIRWLTKHVPSRTVRMALRRSNPASTFAT